MTKDRAAVSRIELRAVMVKLRVEKERPVRIAGLDKPAEPGAGGFGVPYVTPVTRLLDEVLKIG